MADLFPHPPLNTAAFSECRTYRYELSHTWDDALPVCGWIMLNPSTADEQQDDPTIRRCKGFARRWGCGGVRICNLFAYRATSPAEMKIAADPIGPDNDYHLARLILACEIVVAAWGVHGAHLGRAAKVANLLGDDGLRCLGTTKDGHPRHPLYVRGDAGLVGFESEVE